MAIKRTRAVEFDRFGGVDVLHLVDHDIPEPGPDEVLVEVLAAGINHIEAFVRQGRLTEKFGSDFPQTQGSDFAGLVLKVGDGVTSVRRNAEVLGFAPRHAHATHVVVPATQVVAKPRGLEWEPAAGLYLAGVAALDTIDGLELRSEDTIVVSAAAGGVGHLETQLAKLAGATVIGTAGERNADFLRQRGVKPVVYGPGLADRIRELAPRGVTAYIDNFGQDGEEVANDLGVPTSRYRSSEDRSELEIMLMNPDAEEAAHAAAQLERLAILAGNRSLSVLISGYYPFDFVADAFDDLEKLHARGKIVLGMRPANNFRILKARDQADRSA